ncbi:unnamed protein product [Lymnaea stagnalis]|uniref:Secreted protein n=1 Tax=Lymnaea stagnalis TaxID=6523 RepID=A0AAV2I1F7_LYMST
MHRLQLLLARSAWYLVLTISLTSTARHVHAVEPGCLEKVSECLGDALDYVSCAFINDQKECLSLNCSESDSQFVRSESCKMVQLNEAVAAVLNMTSHHCAMRLGSGCFNLAVGSTRSPDVHQVSDYLKYTCEIVRSPNVTVCLTKNNGEDDPGCSHDEHDRLSGAICEISGAAKTTVVAWSAVLTSVLVCLMNCTRLQRWVAY